MKKKVGGGGGVAVGGQGGCVQRIEVKCENAKKVGYHPVRGWGRRGRGPVGGGGVRPDVYKELKLLCK